MYVEQISTHEIPTELLMTVFNEFSQWQTIMCFIIDK